MKALVLLWVLAPLVQGAWRVTPASPTVGDTVWIERVVAAEVGTIVRAAPWEAAGGPVEALGAPLVLFEEGGRVRVRYALVAWESGTHTVTSPTVWRVFPDGRSDSVRSSALRIAIASVLPGDSAAARPPRPPVARHARSVLPPAVALLAVSAVLGTLWRWRRRPLRGASPTQEPVASVSTADVRVGDPRVDAARIAARLRAAIEAREPTAHRRLTAEECLVILDERRPDWPLEEMRHLLRRLDTARFAPLRSHDAAALSEEARALEARL